MPRTPYENFCFQVNIFTYAYINDGELVGGGSCLVRNFGEYEAGRVVLNEDICATAKGYELLSEGRMRKAGGIV